MYRRVVKRMLDLVLSSVGIAVLALPMAVIALLVKITDPGSAIFKQKRIGRNGRIFMMYKFRTMKTSAPESCPTHLLDQPQRHITKLGRSLRKTSLDELPQLFNIWKGQMSFVGPRPALWNQQDLIDLRQALGANELRPGLTGWAQINGRDALSLSEKAARDGEYVRKMGFLFDCKCFFATLFGVFRGKDVIEGGRCAQ